MAVVRESLRGVLASRLYSAGAKSTRQEAGSNQGVARGLESWGGSSCLMLLRIPSRLFASAGVHDVFREKRQGIGNFA